ncbi:MAG TPA: hypothetical protein VGI95_03515 [Caulobacteraceae bacterium]|jgi:hypothetical protein
MRMMIIAAASLLCIAGPAFSFDIEQRGHLDANGRCHAENGQFTYQRNCAARPPTYTLDAKGRCHASNGQFVPIDKCRH